MPFRTRRVFLWQWALGAFQLGMGWGNIWQPLTLKQSVQEAKVCPKQPQDSEAKLQGTEKTDDSQGLCSISLFLLG